ncbi:MAG: hypothetical protein ACLFQK_12145, partial [Fibrobacterota bacterium]
MTVLSSVGLIAEKVSAACLKTGRKPGEVRIMAVTKTRKENEIAGLLNTEIRLAGENRATEIIEKAPFFKENGFELYAERKTDVEV